MSKILLTKFQKGNVVLPGFSFQKCTTSTIFFCEALFPNNTTKID